MIYNSSYNILLDILDALGGDSTKHFNSSYDILLDILAVKGGTLKHFNSSYDILLAILEQVKGSVTKHFNSSYDILLDILDSEGGDITKHFNSSYDILLDILEQVKDGSPYNEATTAILKEAFPAYWNEIKDYGLANPNMVQYVNEDPYIVVSLGLVSGVNRYLKSNYSKNTYPAIYTNISDSRNNVYRGNFKMIHNSNAPYAACFGIYTNEQSKSTRIICNNGNSNSLLVSFDSLASAGGTLFQNVTANEGEPIEFEMQYNYKTKLNNVTQTLGAVIGNENVGKLMFYKGVADVNSNYACTVFWSNFEIINDNNTTHKFIPFIRNNVFGLIDIITNTYYINASNGGYFSIEYYGCPYLNITSTARNYIIYTYGNSAWETVKTYFSDPTKEDLVKYVNEDPDIVCNLVDIGKIRSIVTDGSAYIDTNYTATGGMHAFLNVKVMNTGEFYFGSINLPNNTSNEFNRNHFRTDNATNTANLMVLDRYGSNKTSVANKMILGGFNDIELSTVPSNIFLTVNGTTATNSSTMSLTPVNTVVLFYMRYDALVSSAGHACAKLIIKNSSDVTQREMYPFVRNSVNGMIDVLSNTFYSNANSTGAFTIITQANNA